MNLAHHVCQLLSLSYLPGDCGSHLPAHMQSALTSNYLQ